MINKNKTVHISIISVFVLLYFFVSIISMIHVIDFFELSNNHTMSLSLAIAFELGAAASLASIIVMHRMKKAIVWSLFILLTLMQAMGNMYNSFANLAEFQQWIELFGLTEEPIIVQKRILATISGLPLPLIALGFIKALIDYLKPQQQQEDNDNNYLDYNVVSDGESDVSNSPQDYEELDNETKNKVEDEVLEEEKKEGKKKDVYDEQKEENHNNDRSMMPRRRKYGSGEKKNKEDELTKEEKNRLKNVYKDFKRT